MKLDLNEMRQRAGLPIEEPETPTKVSIRELLKQKEAALEAYHAEAERIDAEIEAIREKRGTRLKDQWADAGQYFEPGRDRMPTPSGGMGGAR
ncbi:hypothetical protein E4H12_01800 [Candidatus Thorarchaeota archaeon]|nr:MAG: hypothetical protein E4H12_01800 [Candidatus Thorarchaeota archaeon]